MKKMALRLIMVLIVLIASLSARVVEASAFDGTSGGSFFIGVNSKTANISFVNWYKARDTNYDEMVDTVDMVGSTNNQSVKIRSLDVGLYSGDGKVQLLATDFIPNTSKKLWAWEATGTDTIGSASVWSAGLGRIGWDISLLEPVAGKSLLVQAGGDTNLVTWSYSPGKPNDVPTGDNYWLTMPTIPESVDNFVVDGNQYIAIGGGNGKVYIKGVNTTDGSYTNIVDFNCPGGNPSLLAIGDMNTDGKKDDLLIYCNSDERFYWYKIIQYNMLVLQANWSAAGLGVGSVGTGLAIGDPVGDGKNRIIFTSSTNDNYYILGYNVSLGRPVVEYNATIEDSGYTYNGLAIDAVTEQTPPLSISPSTSVRQKICLNGVWKFAAAGTTSAIPSTWALIRVPSSWINYGADNFAISAADAASSQAWFERTFYVPASWADGRRIKLRFLDLDWAHKVYINGMLVHSASSVGLCFTVDITSYVSYGQNNTLDVWVQRDLRGGWRRDEAGIVRSVYLETVPRVHVDYSHVITSVQNMTVTVKTRVKNEDTVSHIVVVRPVILDNDTEILTIPSSAPTVIPAGESVEIQTTAAWSNPVKWGFGQYGQPYLYHLETSLDVDGQPLSDCVYDRFGFREFRTSGTQFLFNEIPYYIKGDLITHAWPFVDNPNFVTAFYQASRAAHCSFQRMHSHNTNSFDSHYWYDVGDELGYLVEAQLNRTQILADDPKHLMLWTNYVNYHFNHPSIVMWCPDNEHFTGSGVQGTLDTVTQESVTPFNNLATHIRTLDSSRIVDFHHGWALYKAVTNGWFDSANFMTFNIHPYGTLSNSIASAKTGCNFNESVPTLVGEIFDFPRPLDMIADPIGTYTEQLRQGTVFYNGFVNVFDYGVAGSIWCALQRNGYIGSPESGTVKAGPWTDYVIIRDGQGNPTAERICQVNVKWPSLSGEGTKADFIRTQWFTTGSDGGYGNNINWFDSTRPMFNASIVHTKTKEAYASRGSVPPALGPVRANEVVVCFGIDGVPREGAYVYLEPTGGQAWVSSAVSTDSDGTAWFRVWSTGSYDVVALYNGSRYTSQVTLPSRPVLSEMPGYDHLIWVDMGGINISQRQAELASAPTFRDENRRVIVFTDRFEGGNFDKWTDGGSTNWDITTSTYYSASRSARHTYLDNDLISDNINTSRASKILISFWCRRNSSLDANDILFQIYNGTSYNTVCDIASGYSADTWTYYSYTITDPQYFKSNFRIKFEGSSGRSLGEYFYVDDVVVSMMAPPRPGDANGDGMVDVGDLGILAANYGGSGKTWEQGDFNGDGLVDVGDLGILAANYGMGVEAAMDFNADYAKAFGASLEDEDSEGTDRSLFCSSLGLSLVAGLVLMGLMFVKQEK